MSIDARRLLSGRGLLVTVVAAGILAGGGATAFAAVDDDGPCGGNGAAPSGAVSPSADGGETVTAAEAAALKAAAGKVEEIDLEDSVWEVDVLADDGGWRDVNVDSRTGKVLSDRADRSEDGDDERSDAAALRKAGVAASEAAGVALKAASGAVTSVEFGEDDGKAVWEVAVGGPDGNGRELTVDAATAKILGNDGDGD